MPGIGALLFVSLITLFHRSIPPYSANQNFWLDLGTIEGS